VTIVITGSNGFSAGYMSKFIKENTLARQIIGIDLSNENKNGCVDEYFALKEFEKCSEFITGLRDDIRFFHLGGLLGRHPLPTLVESNVLWTSRYIESASRIRNLQCFLNIGSSAEYGSQDAQILSENLVPNPVTDYGISKHLQTELVLAAGKAWNVRVICTRTFNLIGVGLRENLVVGKILREFREVEEGSRDKVELGRMDSKRDFIDVRDAVKAYWLLSEKAPAGEVFNVASGKSHEIREIYDICASIFGFFPDVDQKISVPLSNDVDYQYADVTKLKSNTAFECLYPVEVTLRDMKDALR
jgi:nucleoside-diphosphate-sugar epimerase